MFVKHGLCRPEGPGAPPGGDAGAACAGLYKAAVIAENGRIVTTITPGGARPATRDADPRLLDALARSALGDGGFAERPGGRFSAAATAWAALALAKSPERGDIAARAAKRLARAQLPDGRVPVSEAHPEAAWPTPLALLAWRATGAAADLGQRAATFLLSVGGTRAGEDTVDRAVVGHDVTIVGWPWILGTHSWVEPTALAVLALSRAGHAAHPRVGEGVRLLLDRQLARGGWNYGNTTVYGVELRPQIDATGAALAALAGAAEAGAVAVSLALLESSLPGVRTPLSLGWGIVGLAAWGRRPAAADAWIEECLALGERRGGWATTHLALLMAASAGVGGLGA